LTRSIYRGSKAEVIYVGAEAVLIKYIFLGFKAVYKFRVSKPYRDSRLDSEVRRARTINESRILINARLSGVNVPVVFYIDIDKALIVMEYIEGELLKDVLSSVSVAQACSIIEDVGVLTGRLHKAGIVHGDLTTSNIIVSPNGEVYAVDFGLSRFSSEVEDRGVDVHLFIRSLESTHYSYASKVVSCFLKGYGKVVGPELADLIKDKVKEIRMRGRYVEERRGM